MIHDFNFMIPLSTSKETPVSMDVHLARGTLTQIRVTFPPGCATLVYVSVRDRLNQILPANRDGALNFDDVTIVSNLQLDLLDPPYRLTLWGWSPDTFYNHNINVQFDMSPLRGENWQNHLGHLFGGNNA